MDGTFVLDVISRITHVTTAIVLVGGSIFSVLVLQPSVAGLADEAREGFLVGIISRWKKWVHLGILLFLVSGLYNYVRAIGDHKGDSLYHALLGTKMLLALAVFFLASALVGRSQGLKRFRESRRFWTTAMVLIALVIVGISGFVKVRGKPVADAAESSAPELSAPELSAADLTPAAELPEEIEP
jgi:uncharacterized membrane protein